MHSNPGNRSSARLQIFNENLDPGATPTFAEYIGQTNTFSMVYRAGSVIELYAHDEVTPGGFLLASSATAGGGGGGDLPTGLPTEVIGFDDDGNPVAKPIRPEMWTEWPDGPPTEGFWAAGYAPGEDPDMAFIQASFAPLAGAIVMYNSDGRVRVGAPTTDDDAVTKAYSDASKIVSLTYATGGPTGPFGRFRITFADDSTMDVQLPPLYTSQGNGDGQNFKVLSWSDFQQSYNCNDLQMEALASGNVTAGEAFVLAGKTTATGPVQRIPVMITATVDTIPRRTVGGRLAVGTPTVAADATTKAYVDGLIQGLADRVTALEAP